MDVLKSETGEGRKGEDYESRTAQVAGTAESPASGPENNDAPIQCNQSAALSIGSDGNCCVLKSSNFSGTLCFEGAVRIECRVSGEVHGTDVITVSESAVVTGPIRAPSVLIAGRVSADITASQRIEIRPSGRVSGNLTAPAMMVHENATVDGRFTMTPARS